VAWLLPELEDGAEPELRPLELLDELLELELLEELELEPVEELEPEPVEELEPEPADEFEFEEFELE
jgi:hypothetical protein